MTFWDFVADHPVSAILVGFFAIIVLAILGAIANDVMDRVWPRCACRRSSPPPDSQSVRLD